MEQTVKKVKNLVDVSSIHEDARAYVVASARCFNNDGYHTVVVTSDYGLKPPGSPISTARACEQLGITWITPNQFLINCGFNVLP